MDPWLELYWRDVHSSLIIYIRDQLQSKLPAPLVARAEESVMVDVEEERPLSMRPDVSVSEDWRGGATVVMEPPKAVAEPVLVRVAEPEVHRRVEIIDGASGGKIVTAIEVLSPSNKEPGVGRDAYRLKQRASISAGVNLVEIDLIRAGHWAFAFDESSVPSQIRAPYMVCVFRGTRLGERAFYPLPLRERLPSIAIPLRPQDRDVALDLQAVIDEAYEKGRYDRTNYQLPLNPPLAGEDAAWVSEVLYNAKRV